MKDFNPSLPSLPTSYPVFLIYRNIMVTKNNRDFFTPPGSYLVEKIL